MLRCMIPNGRAPRKRGAGTRANGGGAGAAWAEPRAGHGAKAPRSHNSASSAMLSFWDLERGERQLGGMDACFFLQRSRNTRRCRHLATRRARCSQICGYKVSRQIIAINISILLTMRSVINGAMPLRPGAHKIRYRFFMQCAILARNEVCHANSDSKHPRFS